MLRKATLQKAAFGFLSSKRERRLIRLAGVRVLAESSAQFGARGVSQPIVAQVAALEDRVDQRHPRRRPVPHGDRDCPIQFDHGRSVQAPEDVVETDDLGPIG